MCIVYCITNLTNGKRYVGWTNKTLEQRWKKHVSNALVRKRRFLLSKAIRKYGTSDDVWQRAALAQVETPEDAKRLEIKFIVEFNSCALVGGHGYNMTWGGDGGTLSGAANPFYGRRHSQESIEKMRQTLGDRLSGENNPQWGRKGELSPCWGLKHSEESRRKRSAKLRGRVLSEEAKLNMRRASQDPETKRRRSEAQKLRRQKEREARESLSQSSTN